MDGVLPEQKKRSPFNWLLLAQFLALFSIIGLLFQNSLIPLFARWIKWDQDLSHSIPTLAALLYLISRTQYLPHHQNSRLTRSLMIGAIASLSLIWCLFIIANITILANFAVLMCIPLIVAASYSTRSSRFLLPIIGMLFFTLPFFDQLNGALVWMSAKAVGFLVQLVGMTVLLDGQNIFIPSGHIYIADGCSGLRYFTISILLGYILSILNNYSLKETVITLLLAACLGLLTNWLRIFFLVVIGDWTDMKSSLMQDHEMFGWVLFSCVIFPAIFFAPIKPKPIIPSTPLPKLRAIPSIFALAIGPLLLAMVPGNSKALPQLGLDTLQAFHQQSVKSAFTLNLPQEGNNESAKMTLDGVELYLSLSQYRPSSLKEKMIPYFGNLYSKEEWKATRQPLTQLEPMDFQTLILTRGYNQENVVLIYRFEVGPYNTSDYELAKIFQIPATFAGKRYSNFFSILSPCKEDQCANELQAAAKLAALWEQNTKALR